MHVSVLVVELCKLLATQNEDPNALARKQRQQYLLEQAVTVLKWQQEFNPTIHTDPHRSLQLQKSYKTIQKLSKKLVQEFPKFNKKQQNDPDSIKSTVLL